MAASETSSRAQLRASGSGMAPLPFIFIAARTVEPRLLLDTDIDCTNKGHQALEAVLPTQNVATFCIFVQLMT